MDILYFDNSATTRVDKEVLEEMLPYFSNLYGNASAAYSIGRNNKKKIEEARKKVADLIGAKPKEIYFTSGGSESDNTALKGIAYANRKKGNHIITSRIEHPAVLESCKKLEKQGFRVTYLDVDKDGVVDLNKLRKSITKQTILISIMFANNEIGTIEPIEEIGKIAKANNIVFHTDSVQAVGNIEINVEKMKIDSLSLSSHKIYGPKGIGALYVRKDVDFERFIDGGHQEKNKRAGTENVPAIVGLGKAAELAKVNLQDHINHLKELRDYYIERIEHNMVAVKLNGSRDKRLPGNANFSFKNIDGSAVLYDLDLKGICVSTGSACNSESAKPSHVLQSIGLSEEWSNGTIRTTFGDENTKEEIDILVEAIKESVNKVENEKNSKLIKT